MAITAVAHVGDTEEQLRKRFDGAPRLVVKVSDRVTKLVFKRKGLLVISWLVDDTVSQELYDKLGEQEAIELRDANGAGWTETSRAKGAVTWSNGAGMKAWLTLTMFFIMDNRAHAVSDAEKLKELSQWRVPQPVR